MKFAVFIILSGVLAMIGQCAKECPYIPTIQDFDLKRFAGEWNSIYESDDPRLPCLHYRIEETSGDQLKITFLPYNIEAITTLRNPKNISEGFEVQMDLPKLDGAITNVFATDYESYAGFFTCKQTETISYYSVTFWSKTESLTLKEIDDLKAILDMYRVKYDTLQPIARDDCKV